MSLNRKVTVPPGSALIARKNRLMEIRRATTDEEFEALLAVRNEVWPRDPYSLTELRSLMNQVKEIVQFVAWEGDGPVGAGDAGLLAQSPEPFAHAWVLQGHRRRGVGSELYAAISAYAGIAR